MPQELQMTAAPPLVLEQGSGSMPVPVQSGAAAIISMVERAARDPSVDVDKLERLMAMAERMKAQDAAQAFDQAMAICQAEMRPVATDSNNPQTKSRYASYFALDKALRPIYSRHGFALSFNTEPGAAELYVRVACHVSHKAGHGRDFHIDMPADGKGAKGGDVMTKTHATGSAVSYGMRYLLKMIFNTAVGEDDDDGNAAGAGDVLTDEQADTIRNLLTATKSDLDRFLKWADAESVSDIRQSKFKDAVAMLNAKKKQQGGKP